MKTTWRGFKKWNNSQKAFPKRFLAEKLFDSVFVHVIFYILFTKLFSNKTKKKKMFFFFFAFLSCFEECDPDDYFCPQLNEIEDRIKHPKKNATAEFKKSMDNFVNESKETIEQIKSEKKNSFNEEPDLLTDPSSKLVTSYLFSRFGEDGVKEIASQSKRLLNIFSHAFPEIEKDDEKGWNIKGSKGAYTFMLKDPIKAKKVVIPFVEKAKCSPKVIKIIVKDENGNPTEYGPFTLEMGKRNVQEFELKRNQISKAFTIEVLENYGDDFTCFAGAEIFQQ